STMVLFNCRSTPQKLSLGTMSSTTIPLATPGRESGAANTLASAVCAERKLASVTRAPTGGELDIFKKRPLSFTWPATASSCKALPLGPRQLTSTGTTTGKRRLFRRSTSVPSALIGRFFMMTFPLSLYSNEQTKTCASGFLLAERTADHESLPVQILA